MNFFLFLLALVFGQTTFSGQILPVANPPVQQARALALPQKVVIPKINLEGLIEPVGIDREGRMGMPQEKRKVGWYALGPKPGQVGSAVLAGHFKVTTGPSVFFRLNELVPGDQVVVVDQENYSHRFLVTKKALYAESAFPMTEVFGQRDGSRLNLITCAGKFDSQKGDYLERLVVYTHLVS